MIAQFLDPCDLRVVEDGGARPVYSTLAPMTFLSAEQGREYTVPAGFFTDGPSIPVLLAPLVGGTPGLRAAVLHDYLLRDQYVSRETADKVFHEALIASGVDPAAAGTMYNAVRAYSNQTAGASYKPPDPWEIA